MVPGVGGREGLVFNRDRVSVVQDEKCSGDRRWGRWHHDVNVLSATEPQTVYVCAQACVRVFVYVSACARVCVQACVRVCRCARACVCACRCVCRRVCACACVLFSERRSGYGGDFHVTCVSPQLNESERGRRGPAPSTLKLAVDRGVKPLGSRCS